MFISVIPVTYLWIGDIEMIRDLFPVSLKAAIGNLITFGLPITWLAWQSQKIQQPVFKSSQSKMVLVLATIITAMSSGMHSIVCL